MNNLIGKNRVAVPFARFMRMAFVLCTVCVSTAVSCPSPTPEPEPIDPVTPSKSEERKNFEAASAEGLYIKGDCVLQFNERAFQKAWSTSRKSYRIQSDDQTRYMHITYSGNAPSGNGDESGCTVQYNLGDSGETVLIVKFVVVQAADGYLWLWNELQKVGVITPVIK